MSKDTKLQVRVSDDVCDFMILYMLSLYKKKVKKNIQDLTVSMALTGYKAFWDASKLILGINAVGFGITAMTRTHKITGLIERVCRSRLVWMDVHCFFVHVTGHRSDRSRNIWYCRLLHPVPSSNIG